MADLSDRLRELLRNHELTLEEFSQRVNEIDYPGAAKLNRASLAHIMNDGRQPGYKTIIAISRAFNVSCDYLLGVSDIHGTANDDENIAAKTTGLSTVCISQLHELSEKSPVFSEYARIIDAMIDELYQDMKTAFEYKDEYQYSIESLLEEIRSAVLFYVQTQSISDYTSERTSDYIILARRKEDKPCEIEPFMNNDGSAFEVSASVVFNYLEKELAGAALCLIEKILGRI